MEEDTVTWSWEARKRDAIVWPCLDDAPSPCSTSRTATRWLKRSTFNLHNTDNGIGKNNDNNITCSQEGQGSSPRKVRPSIIVVFRVDLNILIAMPTASDVPGPGAYNAQGK